MSTTATEQNVEQPVVPLAPLRERAAQALATVRLEAEQVTATRQREQRDYLWRMTKASAQHRLGIELRDEEIEAVDADMQWSQFTVEDCFTFRVYLPGGGRSHLSVSRQCTKPDCVHRGFPVWQPVLHLLNLADEGPFAHDFACQYPTDEWGDPIIPEGERRKPALVVSETDRAIVQLEEAAERLGQAERAERVDLADQRPLIKAAGIKRIMVRDGIPATPAEKIIETDDEYMAHRRKEADAIVERFRATGAYEAARLRAWSAVRAVGVVE